MATRYFTRATFDLLKDLEENNNRTWFQENKHRYEEHVRDSSIRFITDFGPRLKKISEHFRAGRRLAISHLSGHPFFEGQASLQDHDRDPLSA